MLDFFTKNGYEVKKGVKEDKDFYAIYLPNYICSNLLKTHNKDSKKFAGEINRQLDLIKHLASSNNWKIDFVEGSGIDITGNDIFVKAKLTDTRTKISAEQLNELEGQSREVFYDTDKDFYDVTLTEQEVDKVTESPNAVSELNTIAKPIEKTMGIKYVGGVNIDEDKGFVALRFSSNYGQNDVLEIGDAVGIAVGESGEMSGIVKGINGNTISVQIGHETGNVKTEEFPRDKLRKIAMTLEKLAKDFVIEKEFAPKKPGKPIDEEPKEEKPFGKEKPKVEKPTGEKPVEGQAEVKPTGEIEIKVHPVKEKISAFKESLKKYMKKEAKYDIITETDPNPKKSGTAELAREEIPGKASGKIDISDERGDFKPKSEKTTITISDERKKASKSLRVMNILKNMRKLGMIDENSEMQAYSDMMENSEVQLDATEKSLNNVSPENPENTMVGEKGNVVNISDAVGE